MAQQTAVEWLVRCLFDFGKLDEHTQELIEQAKQMEKEQMKIELPSYDNVTRFEVIDHKKNGKGRILVQYNVRVEVSIQDEGRTMKVFLTDQNK